MYNHYSSVGDSKMWNLRTVSVLLISLLFITPAWAADFDQIGCKVGGKIVEIVPYDVNGDQLLDLVVSYKKGLIPEVESKLAVFLHNEQGYGAEPDLDYRLPADTCLFDVADLDTDGLAELILVRKWKVQYFSLFEENNQERKTLLPRGSGVIFPPYGGEVPYEHLVRDWHGNGNISLALPDYGALRFFAPDRNDSWQPAETVALATRGWIRARGLQPAGISSYTFHSGIRTPSIFSHFSANNGTHLILTDQEEIWFHRLNGNGRFPKNGKRFFLPIFDQNERQRENVNLLTWVDDLDGDGHPEAILNKFGGSLTSFRSKIHIHQGNAQGFAKKPGYVYQQKGYSAYLRFWDVDGDGKKEMGMPSADIGLMQLARMLISQSIKLDFRLYRCRKDVGEGMYGPEPDLTNTITFKIDPESNMSLIGFVPSFDGDFDGDGRLDLFMSYEKGFAVWRNEGDLRLAEEPMMSYQIPPAIAHRLRDLNNDGKCDLFLWDSFDPEKYGKIEILLNRQ